MATFAEITEGHSQRISRLARERDQRLHDAADTRDRHLRAIPSAAKLYDAFDEEIAGARKKQLSTDANAEAARAGALQQAGDALREALDRAQQVRRDADVKAFEKRRRTEEDTEHEFLLAIAATPGKPSTEAQKVRAEKMAKAKKEFDDALAAAQEQFRQSRDAALLAESQSGRAAHRGFTTASSANEASARIVRAAADQKLAKALSRLPEAQREFDMWKEVTAVIVADYRREEAREFERFHREMEALRA